MRLGSVLAGEVRSHHRTARATNRCLDGATRHRDGADVIIFGSPGRYVQGRGVFEKVGTELARLGASAVLLVDPVVRTMLAETFERSCAAACLPATILEFGGEASPEEIDRLE